MAQPLEIVIVGHVDHGKSTLVGRLAHETGSMSEGRVEQIRAMCERRGMHFEWAFLTDALKIERDQNVTIDTSQIWFETRKRPYVIIDAPGHREFLKHMITGAASASAALLVVSADEGVRDQSRRHGYMLSLLGIKQVAVIVNKMDLVDYSQQIYDEIAREYRAFLADIGLEPRVFIPVSARKGDAIAERSQAMPWWEGPTVVEQLDAFDRPTRKADAPLRLPIQDVYQFDQRRILAGRIESGQLERGDEIVFLPTGRRSKIRSIERWNPSSSRRPEAGISIGITLEEQLGVERGHLAVHPDAAPALTREIHANVFWMGKRPLKLGGVYTLKLATQEVLCRVSEILAGLDTSSLEVTRDATEVLRDDVGTVVLETDQPVWCDDHRTVAETGRFVLVDGRETAGGGIVVHADGDIANALHTHSRKTRDSCYFGEDRGAHDDDSGTTESG